MIRQNKRTECVRESKTTVMINYTEIFLRRLLLALAELCIISKTLCQPFPLEFGKRKIAAKAENIFTAQRLFTFRVGSGGEATSSATSNAFCFERRLD